ncbi:Lysozyme 2 [Fragariocoptes setiger]|uniref:lysozyme n=1 Tax=Fragariocoptes setiger TaxID=1670756 RepID=A0ABQ7S7A8_9ACAR|nr:Lysozyme 2 [Fragariocoptes setiger]
MNRVVVIVVATLLASRHHQLKVASGQEADLLELESNESNKHTVIDSNTNDTLWSTLNECLACICESTSSNCYANNSASKCQSYYCGPYQLSYVYWADAGAANVAHNPRANPDGPAFLDDTDIDSTSNGASMTPTNFESCALDRQCAARTVRRYFMKYLKDCDGDSRITCNDMASVHRAGAAACNTEWLLKTKFWSNFKSSRCYTVIASTSTSTSDDPNSIATIIPTSSANTDANANTSQPFSSLSSWISNGETTRATDKDDHVTSESLIDERRTSFVVLPHSVTSRSAAATTLNGPTTTSTTGTTSNRQHRNRPIAHKPFVNLTVIRSSSTAPRIGSGVAVRSADFNSNNNDNFDSPSDAETSAGSSVPLIPIDQQCLECMCQAQLGCDLSARNCRFGNVCGPYGITSGYWRDAGSPGTEWITCTRTRECSEQTVRNYMDVYRRDCDFDGRITCFDYAAIHHLGADACQQRQLIADSFWTRFNACLRRAQLSGPPPREAQPSASAASRARNTTATSFTVIRPTTVIAPAPPTPGRSTSNSALGNSNSADNNRLPSNSETPRIPVVASTNSGPFNLPPIQPDNMEFIPQPVRRLVIGQSRAPSTTTTTTTTTPSSTTTAAARDINNNSDELTVEFETHDSFSSSSRRVNALTGLRRPPEMMTLVATNSSGTFRLPATSATLSAFNGNDDTYPRIPTRTPIVSSTVATPPDIAAGGGGGAEGGSPAMAGEPPADEDWASEVPQPPGLSTLSSTNNLGSSRAPSTSRPLRPSFVSIQPTTQPARPSIQGASQPPTSSASSELERPSDPIQPSNNNDNDEYPRPPIFTISRAPDSERLVASALTTTSGVSPPSNEAILREPGADSTLDEATRSLTTDVSTSSDEDLTSSRRDDRAAPTFVWPSPLAASSSEPLTPSTSRDSTSSRDNTRLSSSSTSRAARPTSPLTSAATTSTATSTSTTTSITTTTEPPTITSDTSAVAASLSPDVSFGDAPLPIEGTLHGSPPDNVPSVAARRVPPSTGSERPAASSFETISLDDALDDPRLITRASLSAPTINRALVSNNSSRANNAAAANVDSLARIITSECFDCLCEASTNCEINSKCETSDVKHTRCGMYLVSYDQWLESGLSKQLVTSRVDPNAEERAFYECSTNRGCAEKIIKIYVEKNLRDCDGDGRINCYDVASIHRAGPTQCNSEALLESQYWSDFNGCFGFN